MADPVRATLQRTWRWTASIRVRTAALATLVVAVALVVAAIALVVLQRRTLTDNVDTAVKLRAQDITSLLIAGTLPEELTVLNAEVSLVQVLDDGGRIVGASENILDLESLAADLSPGDATDIRTMSGVPSTWTKISACSRGRSRPQRASTRWSSARASTKSTRAARAL